MTQEDRIRWYFAIAEVISEASFDKSTKVGCVVVGPDKEIRAQGYNGFPRGVDDDNPRWHERPAKYDYVVHAEANAVANAARTGAKIKDCAAYVTHPPCCRCAALLANAGIRQVFWLEANEDLGERWRESFDRALEIFNAAGVSTCELLRSTSRTAYVECSDPVLASRIDNEIKRDEREKARKLPSP